MKQPWGINFIQIINLDFRLQKKEKKRFRYCCRNILHGAYLIKFEIEKLCEVRKNRYSVHYC